MDDGVGAMQRFDYVEAVRLFQVAADASAPGSAQEGDALANLGAAQSAGGNHEAAKVAFARSMVVREGVLEPFDPDLADSLHGLGSALLDLGRPTEAIDHFERTLRIRTRALGGHPQTLVAMHSLSQAMGLAGRVDDAVALLKTTLGILEKVAPANSLTGEVLMDLAALVLDRGAADEARPFVVRALAMTEREEIPNARALMLSSTLDVYAGDLARAEASCARALAIRERLLGDAHRDVRSSRDTLAEIRRRRSLQG